MLKHLWDAQATGGSLSDEALLKEEAGLHEDTLSDIMESLKAAAIVRRTEDGDWMLAMDLSSLTMLDLYRSLPYPLPKDVSELRELDHWSHVLADPLQQALDGMTDSLDVPLRQLFVQSAHVPAGEEPLETS